MILAGKAAEAMAMEQDDMQELSAERFPSPSPGEQQNWGIQQPLIETYYTCWPSCGRHHSLAVEPWTHDPKVVSSHFVWAVCSVFK